VQFEPEGYSLPFFWSGKPAVRSTRSDTAQDANAAIFAGYYVERGLDEHDDPYQQISATWHWHGLHRCLTEPALRNNLNDLMLTLPESRRTVWLEGGGIKQPDGTLAPGYSHVFPYVGRETLARVHDTIRAIPPTQWINLMLGNRFSKSECLERQGDLVTDFRTPIVRAHEIRALVESSIP
jgi:hypothetical protein